MTILWDKAEQGSDEWKAIRRGRITASRAKDARDRLKGGGWSAKALAYAYDVARQRLGGMAPEFAGNGYTKAGQENEPVARMKYEGSRGVLVDEVGFAYTADGNFGVSVDGLIEPRGALEIKTMVSSATLFTALVSGDFSEYRDQCLFIIWMLPVDYVDLVLYCPDLELMRVERIERDDDEIEAFEQDMLKFLQLVQTCEQRLRAAVEMFGTPGLPLGDDATEDLFPDAAPAPTPKAAVAPDALPELF